MVTDMIKKTIAISLIALLLCTMIVPSSVYAEEETGIFAGMSSFVEIDCSDIEEPIMPISGEGQCIINLTYSVIKGLAFRNILYPLFKGRDVNVNLEIIEKSDWCTATLDNETIVFTVDKEKQSTETKLTVNVDEDALAYHTGFVKINVSIEPFKGPLGIITFIKGFTTNFTVEFKPAYLGVVAVEFPDGNSIEISPYNETKISLDVANLGNAETSVFFEIVNSSESFTASIDSEIIIDVDGKATAHLVILADHKFDVEEIKIKITSAYTDNPTEDFGITIYTTLSVKNDGSYVEEEPGLEIDANLLIIILVIIAFVVIALILLKRKLK